MKKIGMQPIPMMDRDKKHEVPQGQVNENFLALSSSLKATQQNVYFPIPCFGTALTLGVCLKCGLYCRKAAHQVCYIQLQSKEACVFFLTLVLFLPMYSGGILQCSGSSLLHHLVRAVSPLQSSAYVLQVSHTLITTFDCMNAPVPWYNTPSP